MFHHLVLHLIYNSCLYWLRPQKSLDMHLDKIPDQMYRYELWLGCWNYIQPPIYQGNMIQAYKHMHLGNKHMSHNRPWWSDNIQHSHPTIHIQRSCHISNSEMAERMHIHTVYRVGQPTKIMQDNHMGWWL